jgi:pilus assembly protein CpaE
MNGRLRLFATGRCDGFHDLLAAIGACDEIELVGASAEVRDAASALAGGHLDAVLHGTGGSEFPAGEVAAIREHTRAPVVLVTAGASPTILDQALEAGVADVLPLPQLTANVVFAIRKVSHAGRRSETTEGRGRIATVFSPKGGTGKTVLSVNLAVSLAKHESRRALLVDLDLQFGDTSIMLGLETDKTIYDLVVAPGELDSEKLAGYVGKHPSGLDVLPAPLRPEDAELVTEAKLQQLLEVARGSYDAIVVDTSPFFHGPMLATLDCTDELLLVCAMDVPTVKNVRLGLQTLDLLTFPPERIKVVLNRANTNVGIKRSEVEKALDTAVRYELPSDRAVPVSVNRGNPVVLSDPRADFSRAVRELAKTVLPGPAEQPKARRWRARAGRKG